MSDKLANVYSILRDNNIEINDALNKEMFESHIRALTLRASNNEMLEVGNEDYSGILQEINPEALELSSFIVERVFGQSNVLESILIATHLQNLINKGKE